MNLQTLVSNGRKRFAEKPAIICDDGIDSRSITYEELWQNVDEISNFFSSLHMTRKIAAVILNQNIHLPAVLLGLLISKCCFLPVGVNGQRYVTDSIRKVGASWIIQESSVKVCPLVVEQLHGRYVHSDVMDRFQLKLVQLNLNNSEHQSDTDEDLAYCITTSGTTGHPKVIKVPHSCIVPNIIDLSSIFQMTESDKILLTAPLTFDPSMIDIFLALSSGATLLIVPDIIKKNPDQLIKVLHSRQNVTMLQATPSLIRQCSSQQLRETILGPNSSLRLLALGGEEFPSISDLRKWMDPVNKTRFYNLYGITEISCWASCEYVDVQNMVESASVVSIGKPLSKTLIRVDTRESCKGQNQGFIWIGSSERVCIVDSENPHCSPSFEEEEDIKTSPGGGRCTEIETFERRRVVWRNTGDVGKVLEDGRIVFLGRQDDQVKRHGKRMNLTALETTCHELAWIKRCHAIMDETKNLIVFFITDINRTKSSHPRGVSNEPTPKHFDEHKEGLFLKSQTHDNANDTFSLNREQEQTLRMHIQSAFPSHYIPDKFVKVEAFPLTTHGKLDKKKLLDMKRNINQEMELLHTSPLSWMRQLWFTYLPKDVTDVKMKDNFLFLGGDSFAAVNLVNQMERFFSCPAHQIMDTLLNKNFGCFVEVLSNHLRLNSQYQETLNAVEENHIEPDVIDIGAQSRKDDLTNQEQVLKRRRDNKTSKHESEDEGDRKLLESLNDTNESSPIFSKATKGLRFAHEKKGLEFCIISRGNRVVNIQKELYGAHHTFLANQTYESTVINDDIKEDLDVKDSNEFQTKIFNHQKNNSSNVMDVVGKVSTMNHEYKRKGREENVSVSDHLPQEFPSNDPSLQLKWKVDTKKCVDASPVFAVYSQMKAKVFIGSHSGQFSAIDMDNGSVIWTTMLSDRIESSACVSLSLAWVSTGCYNGVIYVLNVDTGAIEWEFQTGDSVKCSACVDSDSGHVICGSHDGWLYSLDVENKKCIWKHFFGGASLYSSPVTDTQSGVVYAGSLGGKLMALTCNNGTVLWSADLKKPLFSSPCLHGKFVLVGCVDGHLYCMNNRGQMEWSFKTQGPVFSSPVSHEGFVFFGSHDSQFYCLTSCGQLLWKFAASSPIFSTPFVFQPPQINLHQTSHVGEPDHKIAKKKEFPHSSRNLSFYSEELNIPHKEKCLVVFASTNGTLRVLDCVHGTVIASTDLPGQVFSSPVVHNGRIVVGCRDDLVYCLDFSL